MARKTKTHNLTMTPVMSLAVLTLFAMMIPMFSIANNSSKTQTSNAQVVAPSPSPEPADEFMR